MAGLRLAPQAPGSRKLPLLCAACGTSAASARPPAPTRALSSRATPGRRGAGVARVSASAPGAGATPVRRSGHRGQARVPASLASRARARPPRTPPRPRQKSRARQTEGLRIAAASPAAHARVRPPRRSQLDAGPRWARACGGRTSIMKQATRAPWRLIINRFMSRTCLTSSHRSSSSWFPRSAISAPAPPFSSARTRAAKTCCAPPCQRARHPML